MANTSVACTSATRATAGMNEVYTTYCEDPPANHGDRDELPPLMAIRDFRDRSAGWWGA
jgi:hypothetical protein